MNAPRKSDSSTLKQSLWKLHHEERLDRPAIGLESEFTLYLDEELVRPERVFRDPRDFLGSGLSHRRGLSFNIPTGAAVYFDTGVIEVATPVVEIEAGCAERAVRSLWTAIATVRAGLDDWERRSGRRARLVGFSTHYNVSFDLPAAEQRTDRNVERLALLLTYILYPIVILTATNRQSTGVGVRPRGSRIEVTVDFTPDPALAMASAAAITAICRSVMRWPSYDLAMLDERGIPRIEGFEPMPHTSRKGWLARRDCFPLNPFESDPDARLWTVGDGRPASLRELAATTFRVFRPAVRRLADPTTYGLLSQIVRAGTPILISEERRPSSYEDVGRLCAWTSGHERPSTRLSRYEEIVRSALAGEPIRYAGHLLRPVRMNGWSQIVFRREDGRLVSISLDLLC